MKRRDLFKSYLESRVHKHDDLLDVEGAVQKEPQRPASFYIWVIKKGMGSETMIKEKQPATVR